jgi:hypothetical protein
MIGSVSFLLSLIVIVNIKFSCARADHARGPANMSDVGRPRTGRDPSKRKASKKAYRDRKRAGKRIPAQSKDDSSQDLEELLAPTPRQQRASARRHLDYAEPSENDTDLEWPTPLEQDTQRLETPPPMPDSPVDAIDRIQKSPERTAEEQPLPSPVRESPQDREAPEHHTYNLESTPGQGDGAPLLQSRDSEPGETQEQVESQDLQDETQDQDLPLPDQLEDHLSDSSGSNESEEDNDGILGGSAWESLTRKEKLKPLGQQLASIKAQTACSKATLELVYRFFCKDGAEYINRLRQEDILPASYKTIERATQASSVPLVHIDYWHINDRGEVEEKRGAHKIPQSLRMNPAKKLRHVCYVKLEDIYQFASQLTNHSSQDFEGNPLSTEQVHISCDGVTATNQGPLQFHITSVCFPWCGTPFPWFVWEFKKGQGPSDEEVYGRITDELNRTGCSISLAVADGLERKKMRGMTSTGGYFGCDWCTIHGQKLNVTGVFYEFKKLGANARSHDSIQFLLGDFHILYHVPCYSYYCYKCSSRTD